MMVIWVHLKKETLLDKHMKYSFCEDAHTHKFQTWRRNFRRIDLSQNSKNTCMQQ